jgi:hypothetical protein
VEFKPNGASRNFSARSGDAMNIVAEHVSEYELANSSSSALRRFGDADDPNFVSREVKQSTAREQLRSSQSSGRMFGLAATTVFIVMLILNAISY